MQREIWFNLWTKRLWPYEELEAGDELYWYDSSAGVIVWRSRVRQVEAFVYHDREAALGLIERAFQTTIDRTQPYLHGKPNDGFCLAYQVQAVARVNLPRPAGVRFRQSGWERASRPAIAGWLHA